ncbi:hypothetical protein SK128_014224 [Halocaridina rubra]|uniref:BRICHOS domain-containing protein n=1 Tax=Halocaridina rubra TaxID=373956 RepID=A0AAN9A1T9_HALRR
MRKASGHLLQHSCPEYIYPANQIQRAPCNAFNRPVSLTDKMQAWIVLSLVGCALANTLPTEEVLTMTYNEPSLAVGATMDIHINTEEETIRFHMEEQGNLADVETIEDYRTGFAASKVADEETCYIRKLTKSLEESVAEAEKLSAAGPQEYLGHEDVLAIPAEDVNEWAGERIEKFCGEYAIYKLVKTEEDVQAENEESSALAKVDQSERVSIFFRKCFFFFFFFKCITTTITIPTGTVFFFFFG